jgi:hypothetical protein
MSSATINLIGLAIDAIGAILVFWRTPYHSSAPPMHPSTAASLAASYLFKGKRRDEIDRITIRIGFGGMILGFLLQFVAAIF